MIKFTEHITDYRYILSFDLAKHSTGYSLFDTQTYNVAKSGLILVSKTDEVAWLSLYNQLSDVIESVKQYVGDDKFFVTKEKLPNQAGKFSTIASLQGLAQAHAIFDLICAQKSLTLYDYDGVHSRSVKAYFEREYDIERPQKEDIARCLSILCKSEDMNFDQYDITDSLAVSVTLWQYKWDQDIDEEIKNKKKIIKGYKSEFRKKQVMNEIEALQNLKKGDENRG